MRFRRSMRSCGLDRCTDLVNRSPHLRASSLFPGPSPYNRAMAIKDKVLISLDYVFHPVKAWRTFVADPLEARHQRQLRQQAEKRARLERYLQRYNTVKNRFHDTLDLLESTTRTSVKVAKSVSSAVVGAPGTVTRTVKEVKSQAQGTAEAVAKVSSSVSSVVSKITSVIRKEDGALAGAKGKKDPRSEDEGKADPVKVREIWETKEQTAIRTIWEADELVTPVTPPATAMASMVSVSEPQDENEAAISQGAAPSPSTSSPSSPEPVTRLSFRARVEADEKERFGSRRLKISGNVPPTASPTRGASSLPLDTLSSSATQTFERSKVGPR